MPKKTCWFCFRAEEGTKDIHQARLAQIQVSVRKFCQPSEDELNRRLIKLISNDNKIWKKLEDNLRKDYLGGKP